MRTNLSKVKGLFGITLLSVLLLSWSGNPPDGRTGAPGDGLCSDCHGNGNPGGFDGGITIQNFPSTIMGGQTYSLVAQVSNPNGLAVMAGFQAVVLDNTNNNIGDITVSGTNPATTTTGNGREYVEHNPAMVIPGSNIATWNFDWTAPTGPNGTAITLYAASNLANGNGSTSGDYITTTTATGTLMGATDPLAISIISFQDVDCFGNNTGQAEALATGGTPNYVYAWSTGDSGASVNTLPEGTHTVSVTDANMDVATTTVTIGSPTLFSVSTVAIVDVDCNNSTGTVTLLTSGGTPNYNYNWPSGNMGPTETGLAVGTYEATVLDANGCEANTFFTIQDNSTPPLVNAGPDDVIDCIGTPVTLNGTGSEVGPNITYQWSTTNGNIVTGANTLTPVVDAVGEYSLEVTDNATGCFAIDMVMIDLADSPGLTLSPTNPFCAQNLDGSIDLTIAGGMMPYVIDWSDDNYDGIEDPTGLVAGTYSVTVTDGNSCSSEGSITLTDPQALTVSVNVTPISCFQNCDGEIELVVNGGNGGYTFNWSNTSTDATISNLCQDTFSVIINDSNGCQIDTSIILTAPPILQVASFSTPESCAGQCDGMITVTASGGTGNYQYEWTPAISTTNILTSCPGTYEVTVTDDNGCSAIINNDILGIDSLSATATIVDVSCNGDCDGAIQLTVSGGTGGYSYLWSDGSTDPGLTGVCAGTYTVIITDINGCELMKTYIIGEPQELVLAANIMDAVCNGDCNGNITLSITGGISPYILLWDNGADVTFIDSLCAGLYNVTVIDDNGCSMMGAYTVGEGDVLITSIQSVGETTAGANDGTATVVLNGNVGDFNILWSNSETTASIINLSPGTYGVTVTEIATGCEEINAVDVNQFSCALTATISDVDLLCVDDQNGSATVVPMNGTSPYSYSWSSPITTSEAIATGLAAGTYFVTVEDDEGCTFVLSTTIEEPTLMMASATVTDLTCNGVCEGEIDITVNGGTPPYAFSPANLTDLCAGAYTITVSDDNGCNIFLNNVVVSEPDFFELNRSSTPVSMAGGSNGTATVSPLGGTGPYSILWVNGDTTTTIMNLIEGTYCVTVTDANDCEKTTCVSVGVLSCSLEVSVSPIDPSCFGEMDGFVMATTTGTTSPVTYSWSTLENGASIDSLSAGNYSVTATDSQGCSDSISFVLNDPSDLQLSIINIGGTTCFGQCDGIVELGLANYSYNWFDGFNGNMRQDLCAGDYEVTASDGICQSTISFTIVEPDSIELILSSVDASGPTVADGSANVIPIGGSGIFDYLWSNNATTQAITGLLPGQYCVTVSTPEGCTSIGCEQVGAAGCHLAIALSQSNFTCAETCEGMITPTITGGTPPYTYSWTNAPAPLMDLCVGTYSFTVMDSAGCSAMASADVQEFPELTVEIDTQAVNLDCNQTCNMTLFISAQGVTPFTYDWNIDSLDGTQGADNLCPDIQYVATVTDGNGCSEIFESMPVTFSDTMIVQVITTDACFGSCDANVTLGITGGVQPYMFDTNLPSNFNEICPGDYFYNVTDALGCVSETNFTIGETDEIILTIDEVGSASSINDGFINITASGNGISFLWELNNTFFSSAEDLTDLFSGTYELTITDADGCQITQSVLVGETVNTFAALENYSFEFFPNPANRIINLAVELPNQSDFTISIYDIIGSKVFEGEYIGKKVAEQLSTDNLTDGIYTIVLQTNEGLISEKLIVRKN